MSKLAIIALGGNAIIRGDERGTIQEQYQNSSDTFKHITYLLKEGYNLVLSHGNGPQVGNILLRNDAGEEIYDIPQMPLDICVADSQGGIGYMLEKILKNELFEQGIDREIVTIVTQVVVSKDDPAFKNYTKRVGRLYDKKRADELTEKKEWVFKKSPKRKDAWRRVVPSPMPIEIMNEKIIEKLAKSGVIVIAVGGGGIPVYYETDGRLKGVEAVIDKDAASALLGAKIGADELYMLTDVPYVYKNYGTPQQEILEHLTKADIDLLIKENAFGEGNMLPKIQSALRFVENGGSKSVITDATKLEDRNFGTRITLK